MRYNFHIKTLRRKVIWEHVFGVKELVNLRNHETKRSIQKCLIDLMRLEHYQWEYVERALEEVGYDLIKCEHCNGTGIQKD